MIKLFHIQPTGEATLHLTFSDGTTAHWSAAGQTELTLPLADPAYFARRAAPAP